MLKLTPWFPATVKPVHKGVYELSYADQSSMPYPFHYWDGTLWQGCEATPEEVNPTKHAAQYQYKQTACWRGLAEKPA